MHQLLNILVFGLSIWFSVCSCSLTPGKVGQSFNEGEGQQVLVVDTFHRSLMMDSIQFVVSCPNNSSLNIMTIEAVCGGKLSENQRIEIDGTVTEAQIADSDNNGYPELYCFVTSAGSGSYGKVYGFAVTQSQGLSNVIMPEIMDDDQLSSGYRGHDVFSISENFIIRQFPVYLPDDINAEATGGKRVIMYQLVLAAKGFVLKPIGFENFE